MLPIIAIANFISFFIATIICFRLYRSYLDSNARNILLLLFFKFFLHLAIFFALSFPAIIWSRDKVTFVAAQLLVSYLFLAFATGAFIRIPISVWSGEPAGRLIAWATFLIGWLAFGAGILNFAAARWITVDSAGFTFGYFAFIQPLWIRIIGGGVPLFIAVIGSLFFLVEGWRSTDRRVRTRSTLMGIGMLLLVSAGIANFFIFNATVAFAANLFAALAAILGLVVMAIGMHAGSPTSVLLQERTPSVTERE
ncbi:MAG: hypothetical protein HY460_01740 [Parcubacteria group bacterium]|nr:hypothetical protein [Parcubacteria group bacterium]